MFLADDTVFQFIFVGIVGAADPITDFALDGIEIRKACLGGKEMS